MTRTPRLPAWSRTAPFLIAALALMLAAAPGCESRKLTAAGTTDPKSPTPISAQGRIEPLGGVIEVAGPAGSRIKAVHASASTRVEKDALLVELDDHDLLAAELALIDRQIDDAQRLDAVADAELAQLQRELDRARKVAALARFDHEAQNIKLVALGAHAEMLQKEQETLARLAEEARTQARRAGALPSSVTDQEVESHRILLSRGRSEQQEAASVLNKLKLAAKLEEERLDLEAQRGQIDRQKAKIGAGIAALEAKRKLAKLRLDRAQVRAPIDGTIFRALVHPGETIGAGPVVLMGDTTRMAVVAEVSELSIGDLRRWVARAGAAGLVARARLPGGATVWGRVLAEGIGPIIGKSSIAGVDPGVDVDDRVVEVKIVLDPAPEVDVTSLIRLPVDVKIWDNSVPIGTRPAESDDGRPDEGPR